MFKALLLFLFVFGASTSKVHGISKKEDRECAIALVKAGEIEPSSRQEHSPSNDELNGDNASTFRYFWHKNSTNISVLKTFADKIHIMKSHDDALHIYANQLLITAIFSFMLKMKELIEAGTIDIDILPDYIKETISSLDEFSPVEMFIRAHVINKTAEQLEISGKIDFKYHELRSMNGIEEIAFQNENSYFKEDEKSMRGKRYSRFYIAGLDHVSESLNLAQSLYSRAISSRSMNPYTTHIPEFAALIDSHIAFIEVSIGTQRSSSKADRLRLLSLLKEEANKRRYLKIVTYFWWFNFNLRLAILVTPSEERDRGHIFFSESIGRLIANDQLEALYLEAMYKYSSHVESDKNDSLYTLPELMESICKIFDEFPKRILIPTISKLGIISLSKTDGTKVQLIRLRDKPINVNGILMYPDELFIDDIKFDSSNKETGSTVHVFDSYFKKKLGTLKKPDRQAAEYIYFKLTREHFNFVTIINLKDTIEEGDDEYINLLSFIPSRLNRTPNDVREFINRGERVIIRLVSEIVEELDIIDKSSLSGLSEEQVTRLYYLMIDYFLK